MRRDSGIRRKSRASSGAITWSALWSSDMSLSPISSMSSNTSMRCRRVWMADPLSTTNGRDAASLPPCRAIGSFHSFCHRARINMERESSRAYFRFYAELNDHVPRDQQQRTIEKTFYVPSTVKDMIESFGVPHTEVELIVANGKSVDFSYLVREGD